MADRERTDEAIDSRLATAERARAEALSEPIQERLAAVRRQAVAAMDDETLNRSGFRWSLPWAYALPAGAVAAVALVVALQFATSTSTPAVPDAATLAALLPELDETQQVAAREMELLEELEFLAWMVEVEVGAGEQVDEVDAG